MNTEIDADLTLKLIAVIISGLAVIGGGLGWILKRRSDTRARREAADQRREARERSPDIQARRRAIYDGLVELRDRFTTPVIEMSDIRTLHGLRKESVLVLPDDSGIPEYIDEWIRHAAGLKSGMDYLKQNPDGPERQKWLTADHEAMRFFAEQYGEVLERKFKSHIGTP